MVQRIGRQFPKLEVGGSSPPGSAHGTGLAGAGGSPQNCRWPVRLRPVSLRCSRCGRPGTAGNLGESKLAGYLPPLMEWCGFESRPPDYPAVAQSAERLTIRCAPPHIRPPSCRPRPPSPRLRCGHGSKTAGYLSEKQKPSGSRCLIRAGTGGAAGRVEDGRLSRDRKASRFESCSLPSRRPGAAQPQSVRGELRLPDPTSARAATLQPHHIRPDGRAEPK